MERLSQNTVTMKVILLTDDEPNLNIKKMTFEEKDMYLYCEEHEGIVNVKDIDFDKGEITGFDFPICKLHPKAILHVYKFNEEEFRKNFTFKMFENRKHLT